MNIWDWIKKGGVGKLLDPLFQAAKPQVYAEIDKISQQLQEEVLLRGTIRADALQSKLLAYVYDKFGGLVGGGFEMAIRLANPTLIISGNAEKIAENIRKEAERTKKKIAGWRL